MQFYKQKYVWFYDKCHAKKASWIKEGPSTQWRTGPHILPRKMMSYFSWGLWAGKKGSGSVFSCYLRKKTPASRCTEARCQPCRSLNSVSGPPSATNTPPWPWAASWGASTHGPHRSLGAQPWALALGYLLGAPISGSAAATAAVDLLVSHALASRLGPGPAWQSWRVADPSSHHQTWSWPASSPQTRLAIRTLGWRRVSLAQGCGSDSTFPLPLLGSRPVHVNF